MGFAVHLLYSWQVTNILIWFVLSTIAIVISLYFNFIQIQNDCASDLGVFIVEI